LCPKLQSVRTTLQFSNISISSKFNRGFNIKSSVLPTKLFILTHLNDLLNIRRNRNTRSSNIVTFQCPFVCSSLKLIDHSRIMLLCSGLVFPSSCVNQRLINPASIKPAPLWFYLRLSFMRNSKRTFSLQPIISFLVCMHYPLCQFSGFLTRQCSSSHIHFHCYLSPSHHLLLVSENQSPLVITVLVGFYRHSKSPHSFSFFFHSMWCNYYFLLLLCSDQRSHHTVLQLIHQLI